MTFQTHFDLPRHNPPDVERKPFPDLFDEPDPLDNGLLDSSMISPSSADRRDSFGNSTAFFSPQSANTPWDDSFSASASTTTLPERHLSVSSHFQEQSVSHNPFFNQQSANWFSFDRADSRTPVAPATYEPFSAEFDGASTSAFSQVASAAPVFGTVPVLNNVRPSAVMPPAPTTSPPPAGKEWMAMAEQASNSRVPKRIRQSSPPRSLSPFPRRDGVRKKNARFEIPPERSLQNIDQLISQSNNEEEIKELKQQKRLLRNRQAALDSRQRKKKHTEELEEEKKLYTERNQYIEEEMKKMTLQRDSHALESEKLAQENRQLLAQVENLNWEKENMVRDHTLETGELRRKITILSEKLEATPSVAQNNQASSEFHDFNDLDGLPVGGSDWDPYIWVNDVMDSDPQHSHPKPQGNETTLVVAQRRKDNIVVDDAEKPVASGLLLMLLLCGAFVASRSSGTSAPPIRMSDELRAASATILDNVLKDVGGNAAQAVQASVDASAIEPGPSASSWPRPSSNTKASDLTGNALASLNGNPSSLETLSTQLMTPSKDQEAEAIFGISAAQYNSLTSTEFTRRLYMSSDEDSSMSPPGFNSGGRKNLAETLRVMREEARGNTAAEVYTRSLLWDKIPTEVVREFKKMVEESTSEGTSRGD